MLERKNHGGQYVILFVSVIATLGSLYFQYFGNPVTNIAAGTPFSFGNGFTPCVLCRWARILMYPLVWLSILGLMRKDRGIVHYIFPISIAGILLELYHYLLQTTTWFSVDTRCTRVSPCNALQVNYFGFMTIPFLCLIAFVVICLSCIVVKRSIRQLPPLHHAHR